MKRGNKTLFWLDEWMGSGCLKDQFSSISATAQSKNMIVEEAYETVNARPEWWVAVTRNLNDWEIEVYELLLYILSTMHLEDSNDQLVWKLEKRGEFTAKSC